MVQGGPGKEKGRGKSEERREEGLVVEEGNTHGLRR